MLKVLQRAKKEVPLDIVMNLLAAHSVPQGYTAEEATEMIVKEMIPAVAALKEKGELDVELIDISFCWICMVGFLIERFLREEYLRSCPNRAYYEGRKEARFAGEFPC